jgi:exo-beta-1,3-glucanase (GH17 family)
MIASHSRRAPAGLLLATAVLALFALPARGAARSPAPGPGSTPGGRSFRRESPFVTRPFRPFLGDRWIGNAIAYGPHRDGQRPGGPTPTREQLAEDLRLMVRRWNLIRTYGAEGPADSILDVIRRDRLDLRVMLGIWVQAEDRRDSAGRVIERFPEAVAANRREIEAGVRLATQHPGLVIAVCVGNETQVFWSGNRVPPARLIGTVREVRARVNVPVTVADDFNFWNQPESRAVARELDFIVMHAHPLWNGRQLEEALDWTRATYAEVQAAHPRRLVVIGETGWATRRTDEGDQGRLMKGALGEAEQAAYYDAVTDWARREQVTTFFFEAFDENWKGGDHPDEVEKHWGLFRADRTPKRAVARER